jgi:hypothetical protein
VICIYSALRLAKASARTSIAACERLRGDDRLVAANATDKPEALSAARLTIYNMKRHQMAKLAAG